MHEDEYTRMREHMVHYQLKNRGIRDKRVLAAFARVPRHAFVDKDQRHFAYNDHPLGIGAGQTISQPYIVALMTEALQLEPSDRILEVGTGSGYQTAILAEIVDEVHTIERIRSLQEGAKEALQSQGYENIRYVVGDGTDGHPEKAPYDAILVTAAAREVPKSLLDQLDEGGRMVIPVGGHFFQDLLLITKKGSEYVKKNLGPVRFVPLVRG